MNYRNRYFLNSSNQVLLKKCYVCIFVKNQKQLSKMKKAA
jgi:hypothetical protein